MPDYSKSGQIVVTRLRGADLACSGGLLPFRGAGAKVDTAAKWQNDVDAKPFLLPFQRMRSPLKWK
ncbi:hypothetical protein DDA71_11815 [Bifidobacterium longum subsp. longum]|nr:hypothetical protein [Bifidobacterium longum subsp. longum]